MKKKKLIIFLAGGLGNQLFQLCAGISISEGREIVGELGFSGNRNPDQSDPTISELVLAQDIEIIRSRKARRATQKIFDSLMGVSTKTHGLKSQRFFRRTIELFGTIYFSCYYKKIVHVSVSRGVGYYEMPRTSGNQLIIGYFQSYRYSDEMSHINLSFEIDPVNPGSEFEYFKSKAIIQKPIMLHIRLGDYLSEPNFGILTSEYYKTAIEQFKTIREINPIWVFTDDLEDSKKYFADFLPENVYWIGDVDNSIGSTLALFRYGAGYVIANSSFSWWAAQSRHNRSAKVIHPKPWFKGLETPLDLIPSDWESLTGHTKEAK